MIDENRSRKARNAAEAALVRVIHHYGETPEFVLLGGLVPEILCSNSGKTHAGTSDVDVQVNLEIAHNSTNAARLEEALLNAEFVVDDQRIWRWKMPTSTGATEVKFELLADLNGEPASATVSFKSCESLGAVNLRGTGYAAGDYSLQRVGSKISDSYYEVDVRVTGLAGFLLAKVAAAYGRRKAKDWYDIAFVLLHNDQGGPTAAAAKVLEIFGSPSGELNTMLQDLAANFQDPGSQGVQAYVDQMILDHPEENANTLEADSILAVEYFLQGLNRD